MREIQETIKCDRCGETIPAGYVPDWPKSKYDESKIRMGFLNDEGTFVIDLCAECLSEFKDYWWYLHYV